MIGFNHEGERRGGDRSACVRGYLDLFALVGLEAGDGRVRPPLGMPGLLILSDRWPTSCDSNILIAFSSFISSRLLKPSLPLLPSCSLGINADISSPQIQRFRYHKFKFSAAANIIPGFNPPQACSSCFGQTDSHIAYLLLSTGERDSLPKWACVEVALEDGWKLVGGA